ncbi:hypothetical protein [Nocardioides sp. CFH 31398]|uniref:hypothetical protein n=1 Tax=Nocardioides sp. CFH 31398 TaxID=2919579 RepID=UPI001F060BF9|nr:hypothetical protein [Nocardioides sp. CFH 31398]MCH1867195.1 hypothetical protein [Nocardioides sp. CFH 31398]
MTGAVRRGLLAGAAGTTALNAVTYLDMALRGRPGSDLPDQTVEGLIEAAGGSISGSGSTYEARRTAWGAVGGIGAGLATGVVASVARGAGVRLPFLAAAAGTGAVAMAASDVPAALVGATDPRQWEVADWVADAVPHLVMGAVTVAAVRAQDPDPAPEVHVVDLTRPGRAGLGLLTRSFALGTAAGARTSLGVAGPVLTGNPGRAAGTATVLMTVGEMAADKSPVVPSRLDDGAFYGRVGAGAAGARMLARREDARTLGPVVAGGLGAAVGSFAGAGWRSRASATMPNWAAGLVEDAVAVGLTALACRRRPRR